MKKENKRMAQERRAKERKKAAMKKTAMKILGGVLVAAAIAGLVVLIIKTSNSASSASDIVDTESASSTEAVETTETTDTTDTTETSTSLDTTEGLVAEDGQTVNIDFTGYMDGEAFEGGSSEGYDLELGSGSFIDGFEDAIVGHSVGETFDIDLTFPEDYGNTDLAGQDVTFTVTLNGIYD